MIKKTLVLVLTAALLLGLSGAAVKHWNQYKHKQAQQAQTLANTTVALQKQINDIKASTAAEYNGLLAECQKGALAYANLSQTLKLKIPAPSCPAPAK